MTDDLISRAEAQTAIQFAAKRYTVAHEAHGEGQVVWSDNLINVTDAMNVLRDLPSAQPDTEKICARIKAEAIKRNVEYMKHGDRYMLGFVDGMRLARCIVDGTIDDPVYFTLSGE